MRKMFMVAAVTLSLVLGHAAAAQAAPGGQAAPKRPGASAAVKAPGASAARVLGRMQASAPPVYNNWVFCTGNWAYVDFTDPDGDDLNLGVWAWIFKKDGSELGAWFENSGGAGHGVFFSLDFASLGFSRSDVAQFAVVGLDESGTWSSQWTWVNPNGSCSAA
ncbi:MAG TPA: hypothetical protein VES42_26245 [Pilimelia sp.]|nr:hypothetical protein [Pilimelia sp.]